MMERDVSQIYRDAASAHGAATDSGDYVAANAAYHAVIDALGELRKFDDRGRLVLTLLLQDEDPHVRSVAATHLLPLDEAAAKRALVALISLPRFVGFNASMILKEWNAGRLKVP